MRRLICYMIFVFDWIRYGISVRHLYTEVSREPAIIIATDAGFRVSNNYEHSAEETVWPLACLIKSRCIRCGHEDLSWCRTWRED